MEQEPSLEDTGLPIDMVFKLAQLGLVFERVEMVDIPTALQHEADVAATVPAASVLMTGPFARIKAAHDNGAISQEEYVQLHTDAVHLSNEHFARQYPEYGPYELQPEQAA